MLSEFVYFFSNGKSSITNFAGDTNLVSSNLTKDELIVNALFAQNPPVFSGTAMDFARTHLDVQRYFWSYRQPKLLRHRDVGERLLRLPDLERSKMKVAGS